MAKITERLRTAEETMRMRERKKNFCPVVIAVVVEDQVYKIGDEIIHGKAALEAYCEKCSCETLILDDIPRVMTEPGESRWHMARKQDAGLDLGRPNID